MRYHPRTMLVEAASAKLHTLLVEFQVEHDLTYVEMAGLLLERQQTLVKYMLRDERHPDDPERKADEE